jgi:phosphatidylinositol alpha-1,6-mannosyltransferase
LAGLEVEGLGIVYLEASSCELPVIAGRSGGAPDAVIEGVTGITVDGTKPNEIAAAIISLFDNPAAAREMGLAGRKWIQSDWRWQIWSDAFSELLIRD